MQDPSHVEHPRVTSFALLGGWEVCWGFTVTFYKNQGTCRGWTKSCTAFETMGKPLLVGNSSKKLPIISSKIPVVGISVVGKPAFLGRCEMDFVHAQWSVSDKADPPRLKPRMWPVSCITCRHFGPRAMGADGSVRSPNLLLYT